MRTDRRLEWLQVAILAGMFLLAVWAWPRVPDQVPVHWNLAGEPDRYGGKVEGLLLVPILALGLYGLFRLLPRLDPGGANYAKFAGAYGVIRLAVLALLGVIQLAVVAAALGSPVDLSRVVLAASGLMIAVMGSVLGRLRPNWFVGVRTPWTLSSERSWVATHRLGGRVFLAVGLATFVTALIEPGWALWVLLGGMFTGVAAMVVYSYRVWRDDPDKMPPPGTVREAGQ